MRVMVDEIAYGEAVAQVLKDINKVAEEEGEPKDIRILMVSQALELYEILQLALFEPTRVEGYDE